jgi:signal transduction histidine kinase
MKPLAGSLAARLIRASLLWIVLALGAAVFVLSGLYREHVEQELGERAEGYLDELSAAVDVPASGELDLQRDLSDPLFRRPYSGLYWEVSVAGDTLHRSRSLWDQTLAPPREHVAGGAPAEQAGPEGQHLLVWTRIIRYPGFASPITLRVAAHDARVEIMAASFTRTLAISLAILAAGLIGLVVAQIRFGLAPLRRLGDSITQLRGGHVDRIAGDYPSEIRPLVEDLNAVLHENRELLVRARAQAGNLAHALKTPLAVIRNSLSGPGAAPGAGSMLGEVERMHAAIERHLVRARAGAIALHARHVLIRPALDDVIRAVRRIHDDRVAITVLGPDDLRFRGDAADLQEIFGNLLENASKWARSAVRVELSAGADSVRIVLHDDGPGIPAEHRAEAVKRGVRLDTTRPGSGLGLQIVDELCSVYGGSLELGDSPLGGLAAAVTLPRR